MKSRRLWPAFLYVLAAVGSCFPESAPDGGESPSVSSGGKPTTSEGEADSGADHSQAGGPEAGGSAGGSPAVSAGGAPPDDAAGAAGAPPPLRNGRCLKPNASEELPARSTVLSTTATPPLREVFVADLFNQFDATCGECHVARQLAPGWGPKISAGNFAQYVTKAALARIQSDDPTTFMPPPDADGKPWKNRVEGEAAFELAQQLKIWLDQGARPDVYYVEAGGESSYLLSAEVGLGLTNLGSCVPEESFPFASAISKMKELDERFAELVKSPPGQGTLASQLGLPVSLAETDLVSLDSDALARYGVIAFAPGYPLWSDSAGKLRHVRVPLGKSIRFDPAAQTFDIPENTRFYKTFLKPVVDKDGQPRWRKMETRIIVARKERANADGSRTQQALFGSYKWDETETQATLVTLALNNGEPFTDDLYSFITDEAKAQQVRDTNPLNLTYELEFAGILRRYAIPGRERCIQCHMGSPGADFVLGFTPQQIRRHPTGESGTIEPSADDELNQVDRLIALGVISGIESAEEIIPLEDSQLPRRPRTDYELKAQGYMLGNCAHCHNPRGYPSVLAPELKDLLDFWPSKGGGIFEFPLERMSPRITRGQIDPVQIPYITPSLRELFPTYFEQADYQGWAKKYGYISGRPIPKFYDAPWRSLIFRNVHAPFSYADDYTIFPHMPLNSPGFDCRAPRILGEWMVSVPALRKHPELAENFIPENNTPPDSLGQAQSTDYALVDHEPQPYAEVIPSSPDYPAAVAAARTRLETFRVGATYKECPSQSDIVDPEVLNGSLLVPGDGAKDGMVDNVPDHAHWVPTDLTEPPGNWSPRRSDWKDVLVEGKVLPSPRTGTLSEAERNVVAMLQSIQISTSPALNEFAKKPFPLGLWKQKTGCNFSSQPKIGSYPGDRAFKWMKEQPAQSPVFSTVPGAAVFDMVCVNCHGREADARGRQAETLQNFTGGRARVANLRDGLFNAAGSPTNREREFGKAATPGVPAGDWAGRYLVWMGMGGTQVDIPPSLLTLVGRTGVAGVPRRTALLSALEVGPNMLAVAEAACREVLPFSNSVKFDFKKFELLDADTKLLENTGDAELWSDLCGIDNPSPVRAITVVLGENYVIPALYKRESYPASARVGTPLGTLETGVKSTNSFPWCLAKPDSPNDLPKAQAFAAAHAIAGEPLPFCPEGLLELPYYEKDNAGQPNRERWARRGAINAGLLVYLYLEQVSRGQFKPVRYDECELLGAP